MSERGGPGDGNSGLGERHAVEAEETLPGGLTTESAGLGQCEFGKAEGAVERDLLVRGWAGFGRLIVAVLSTDGGERCTEFDLGKAAGCCLGDAP